MNFAKVHVFEKCMNFAKVCVFEKCMNFAKVHDDCKYWSTNGNGKKLTMY